MWNARLSASVIFIIHHSNVNNERLKALLRTEHPPFWLMSRYLHHTMSLFKEQIPCPLSIFPFSHFDSVEIRNRIKKTEKLNLAHYPFIVDWLCKTNSLSQSLSHYHAHYHLGQNYKDNFSPS